MVVYTRVLVMLGSTFDLYTYEIQYIGFAVNSSAGRKTFMPLYAALNYGILFSV